jgi:hypothetical protein
MTVTKAIQTHGAQAVYRAATRHMEGAKTALAGVGLSAASLADAVAIHAAAYKQMGGAAQAIDKADATAKLDGITARRPGRPAGSSTERTATLPPVRCTPEQRAKFDELGGSNWLREAIDKAKLQN